MRLAEHSYCTRVALQLFGAIGDREQPLDAELCLMRDRPGFVRAAPGMRFEVEKSLFLALQRRERGQQRNVLVHVREIAGVVGVPIFHPLRYGSTRTRVGAGMAIAPE